jgi:hypothetical protein
MSNLLLNYYRYYCGIASSAGFGTTTAPVPVLVVLVLVTVPVQVLLVLVTVPVVVRAGRAPAIDYCLLLPLRSFGSIFELFFGISCYTHSKCLLADEGAAAAAANTHTILRY